MINFLLDTCIISHFFRKTPLVVNKMKEKSPDDLKISSITFLEIEYGLLIHERAAQKIRPAWEELINVIDILPFSALDAKSTAEIRGSLKKQVQMIGAYDILLAGVALHRNLVFVTDNTREFQRIPTLTLENWVIE